MRSQSPQISSSRATWTLGLRTASVRSDRQRRSRATSTVLRPVESMKVTSARSTTTSPIGRVDHRIEALPEVRSVDKVEFTTDDDQLVDLIEGDTSEEFGQIISHGRPQLTGSFSRRAVMSVSQGCSTVGSLSRPWITVQQRRVLSHGRCVAAAAASAWTMVGRQADRLSSRRPVCRRRAVQLVSAQRGEPPPLA